MSIASCRIGLIGPEILTNEAIQASLGPALTPSVQTEKWFGTQYRVHEKPRLPHLASADLSDSSVLGTKYSQLHPPRPNPFIHDNLQPLAKVRKSRNVSPQLLA